MPNPVLLLLIGRTNESQLQSTFHLVDMAQDFTSLDFKKERIVVKKKMMGYQNQLEGYKRLQQVVVKHAQLTQ